MPVRVSSRLVLAMTFIVVAGVCLTRTAHADFPITIEAGLLGGYYRFSEDSVLGRPLRDPNPNPYRDAQVIGVRLGLFPRCWSYIGLELEGVVLDPLVIKLRSLNAWRSHLFVQTPSLRFPLNTFFGLFAVAGLGAQYLQAEDIDPFFTDSNLVIHGGMGAKLSWDIDPFTIGLRFDARASLRPQIHSASMTGEWEIQGGAYLQFFPPPRTRSKRKDES